LINIAFNTVPNIGKIADHALIVEFFLSDGNRGLDAVAMQVAALAGMVHEPMAVAKINFFGDGKHE